MIDHQTIERIQSVAQITEVVSDFITLRKRGVNFVGLCPFHEDKTPSFYVSPAKNICKCFACGEGGTPVHFIMKHEQLPYADALRYLAKKYGIEIKEVELSDEQRQSQNDRESMFILNDFARTTFSSNLYNNVEGKTVGLSYFKERGFRDDIIKKFELGYALEGWSAFSKEALKAGYQKRYLDKTGLSIVREDGDLLDRFRGRVIFPIFSISGKTVGFGGRILKNEKVAKYMNSPDSEVYNKSRELYGIYHGRNAINKQDKCYLVEGYTDVISMHQAGVENVVAPCGTALTPDQIRLIHRLTKNVTLLYDSDAAGLKAANRGISLFLEAGMNVKIVLLPEGEDPDSFARKQNATSFNAYMAENEIDFIQFKARLLTQEVQKDPVQKAALVNEIVENIALIREEIVRLLYIKECARATGINETSLVRAVAKKRHELLAQQKKTLYPEVGSSNGTPDPAYSSQEAVGQGGGNQSGANDLLTIASSPSLDEHEKNILHYVVRYGEVDMANSKQVANEQETIQKDESPNEPLYVIQYVMEELQYDGLTFTNPLYQQILQETLEHFKTSGFKAETYFKNHSDYRISQIASDLIADKYIESKVHSRFKEVTKESHRLIDLVPYVVINYKDAILKNKMDEINKEIKVAESAQNFEEVTRLLKELAELWTESKKLLAKHLGERIITRM